MGNRSSQAPQPPIDVGLNDEDEENSDVCKPCFFLGKGLPKINEDSIGSPMPATPIHQRKQRYEMQQEINGGTTSTAARNGVYSSRYGGLETERTSGSNNGLLRTSNGIAILPPPKAAAAGIHEGPMAEQFLHKKYQLEEVLGVGSTSTVHRCVRKVDGAEFACKVIDVHLIEERFQGMMEQFQTEIQALRDLEHPGIIQLYDVYQTDSKIYIVMEMMQGGELFDYVVEKGTLTEKEASQIVQKVTSAIVYMHSKNIVHRDLKPENLLLKSKPPASSASDPPEIEVKIIDFGLSKAMEEPVARTFLGTRGYLAPEMLQRRDYTRAVDAWALGVIVFVLVCGCLPFDDDSSLVPPDSTLVRNRFTLRFPRWAKNLSPSAKDLLERLLDTNPETRYTAEQALNHQWVQGGTASKKNVLASPGRIRASPALNPGSVRQIRANRKFHQPIASPPVTSFVRKSSL